MLKAVLKADWDRAVRRIDEPFVGLRSMREEEADRFFGRDTEIKELTEKLGKHRIVAIVADSGTGKSSLAEAGFVPAFRGGTLSDPARSEPDDRVWHVASMRPGTNPEEGLKTGVSEAAEKLGLSGTERFDLRKRITGEDTYGRLVVVSAASVEIAHESLITQWPWLQGRLRDRAQDLRRLDRLMDRAQEWRAAPPDKQTAYFAVGAERESFNELAGQRTGWLCPLDHDFIEASNQAFESEREKEQRALKIARHNESVALTALANIEAERRPVNAAKLIAHREPPEAEELALSLRTARQWRSQYGRPGA